MGGQSTTGELISIETFGFDNCTIPSLPEPRYGLGSFLTPTMTPQLAVCGGWWLGKPHSTDCLTLNIASGQWERGKIENLLGDDVRGVISIEGDGVFIVHRIGISILTKGSKSWVAGPVFPTPAECGCNVSRTSFVTIHMSDTQNVREYIVTDGEALAAEGTWPSLRTKRQGPGCGATSFHLVVAGGVSGFDEVLTSVEVFHVATKAIRAGGNLQHARAFFQIIPIGSTHLQLLAVGGQSSSSPRKTSEVWQEDDDSWEEGPELATGRSSFGAIMVRPHLVCLESNPPVHSCPAAGNTNQTCKFPIPHPGDTVFCPCR